MGETYIFDVTCVNCVVGIEGSVHKHMHTIAESNTIDIYTRKVKWYDCMDRIAPLDSPILIKYLESHDRPDDFLEHDPRYRGSRQSKYLNVEKIAVAENSKE